MNNINGKITLKQTNDILRGVNVKGAWLNDNIKAQFSGTLSTYSEKNLRRLMLQMLIKGVLEEEFTETSIPGMASTQVTVYVVAGQRASNLIHKGL